MRLRGTGTDPLGQLVKGTIMDAPADSPMAIEALEQGWVEPVPPEENPGTSTIEVANAVVRGDTFESNPAAAAVAEGLQLAGSDPQSGKDPYATVHQQDPSFPEGEPESGDGSQAGPNASEDERARIKLAAAPRTERGTVAGTIPGAPQRSELPTEHPPAEFTPGTPQGIVAAMSQAEQSAIQEQSQAGKEQAAQEATQFQEQQDAAAADEPEGLQPDEDESGDTAPPAPSADPIEELKGDALDDAVREAGIEGASRMSASEKRDALRAVQG